MRQYKFSLSWNYQDELKVKPMILNRAYYFLLKYVLELKSSKWARDESDERDV
jgi:hypothetical protein